MIKIFVGVNALSNLTGLILRQKVSPLFWSLANGDYTVLWWSHCVKTKCYYGAHIQYTSVPTFQSTNQQQFIVHFQNKAQFTSTLVDFYIGGEKVDLALALNLSIIRLLTELQSGFVVSLIISFEAQVLQWVFWTLWPFAYLLLFVLQSECSVFCLPKTTF